MTGLTENVECHRFRRRVPPGQLIVREINGSVAAYVEPGAPFNKVAGLGFAGVPEAAMPACRSIPRVRSTWTGETSRFRARRTTRHPCGSTRSPPASWFPTSSTVPPSHESLPRDVLDRVFGDTIAAPSFERYLARVGGAIAGGASLRIQDGVAQLSGAATRPEFRRRGVQSALLRHRLAEAARRGSDLAVVTTQPGSKSQENAQKFGFSLLYARAVLVKA